MLAERAIHLALELNRPIPFDEFVDAVKLCSDGALTARTAAVCCDYADRPNERGCCTRTPTC